MITGTDLLSIETEVRDLAGEETAKLWPQARVFRAINNEKDKLIRNIIDLGQGYFETSTTGSMAATITLPANCYVIRNIEIYDGGTYAPLRWVEANQRYQYQTSGGTSALTVRFAGGTLVIESGVGTASSYRIQYAYVPPEMRYEAFAAAAAATFTMGSSASVINDIYIGDTVQILAGTNAGDYRTITDYVGTTKVATVAAWTATPDTTSYYSTLLPDPLSKWRDLVATGAAIRLLYRRRDSELIGMLRAAYREEYDSMINSLGQRETDQVQRVNFIPTWEDYCYGV